MAQTVDQWHAKLKKWVPSWWFENKLNLSASVTDAVFYAAAAVFQRAEQDMDDQQAVTFILHSPAPIIDLLGDERSFPRSAGEADGPYEIGVQTCLSKNVGQTELQLLIDQQLNNGTSFLIENEQYGFWDDPDITSTPGFPYYDDYFFRYLSMHKNYNWWTVVIPIQTGGVDATIRANIIAIIEANKALGTTYDVLYGSSSDTDTDD